MAKLKEVEVPFEQVLKLTEQLKPSQKFQLMFSILKAPRTREEVYKFAEKLAKDKNFSWMSEKNVEDALHG